MSNTANPAVSQRPFVAIAWMLGSVASFVGMSVAGRALKGALDVFEIMTYRSAIGLVIMVVVALSLGKLGQIGVRNLHWHLLRNTVHFIGQGLWFWALMLIPLAQLFAIEFTSPIWVILLAPFLLGEPLNRIKLLATGLGFAGVLIVARPDFSNLNPGVIAAAACAVFFAGNVILTKRLTRGEPVISILFWQTAIQLCLGLLTSGWDGAIALPPVALLPWLLIVGVGGLFAHFCLTNALRLAPASFVMPIDFARLPLAAGLGFALYNEAVEAVVFLGAALIVLGNWINIRYGAR